MREAVVPQGERLWENHESYFSNGAVATWWGCCRENSRIVQTFKIRAISGSTHPSMALNPNAQYWSHLYHGRYRASSHQGRWMLSLLPRWEHLFANRIQSCKLLNGWAIRAQQIRVPWGRRWVTRCNHGWCCHSPLGPLLPGIEIGWKCCLRGVIKYSRGKHTDLFPKADKSLIRFFSTF